MEEHSCGPDIHNVYKPSALIEKIYTFMQNSLLMQTPLMQTDADTDAGTDADMQTLLMQTE
jgi:hypothetical protein